MPVIFDHNGITIWQTTENESRLTSQANLNNAQHKALQAINDSQRRKLWLAARVIATNLFNTTIDYHNDGAPFLIGNPTHISISHTLDYLAFYRNEKPCGIDLEPKTRDAAKLSRKFTDINEIEITQQAYPHNPELLIWCAKESLYKYARIEGAELKTDLKIENAHNNTLICSAFGKSVCVNFMELNNLLIAFTK